MAAANGGEGTTCEAEDGGAAGHAVAGEEVASRGGGEEGGSAVRLADMTLNSTSGP